MNINEGGILMNRFKFNKIDDKFQWESDFMVLEFSNPTIQSFSDYTNIIDEKEIMYYYYTVKVFRKIDKLDDNGNKVVKWELVSERNTHDFPCILELKWMLDYQLKDNTVVDGQKHEYQSGAVRYSKIIATEGFACDDFYEITKNVNSDCKDDKYIVYCGTTFDSNGDLNSSGVRTPYVSRKDIESLFECASEFVQYSIDEHNRGNTNWNSRFEIKHNKVYEYNIDTDNVDKNKVESIYAIGEVLDITTVVDNEQEEYYKVCMSSIDGKTILLNNGDKIAIDTIFYIINNVDDDKLRYKEDEIAQDFLSILSDEEKVEFKNNSVELLLSKYKMAIIDRTWMCRDEHEFELDIECDGGKVECVTPVVENVIKIIKRTF